MNVDYKLIGSRIAAIRKRQGFTQEVLAEKLDVTVGYVSQVERGVTKISLDLLAAISAILACDISELATGSSTGTETYMQRELFDAYLTLNQRERRMVYEFIQLLLKNRT